MANSLPHVQTGKIRAYAVTDKVRLPSAPDIPTFDEAGVPGLHVAIWYGMWAPKGTPDDVIARLNGAVRDALADRRRAQAARRARPGDPAARAADAGRARRLSEGEIERWWPIVRAANIKPQ